MCIPALVMVWLLQMLGCVTLLPLVLRGTENLPCSKHKNKKTYHCRPQMIYCSISKEMSLLYFGHDVFCVLETTVDTYLEIDVVYTFKAVPLFSGEWFPAQFLRL